MTGVSRTPDSTRPQTVSQYHDLEDPMSRHLTELPGAGQPIPRRDKPDRRGTQERTIPTHELVAVQRQAVRDSQPFDG